MLRAHLKSFMEVRITLHHWDGELDDQHSSLYDDDDGQVLVGIKR